MRPGVWYYRRVGSLRVRMGKDVRQGLPFAILKRHKTNIQFLLFFCLLSWTVVLPRVHTIFATSDLPLNVIIFQQHPQNSLCIAYLELIV